MGNSVKEDPMRYVIGGLAVYVLALVAAFYNTIVNFLFH